MGWVLERLGADLGRALTDVNVLAYALDRDGVIVWQNRASQEFIGDVRGSHFHDFIVVEDRRRAQEAFMSKVNGKAPFTDYACRSAGRPARRSSSRSTPCRFAAATR